MHVHLVFVTKYRRGVFTTSDALREHRSCEDFEAKLKEFNGERDHVHLLVHYPPKVAVSKLVNSLKGVSARRIRQESSRPDQPRHHARSPVVALVFLRIVRRSTVGDRPASTSSSKNVRSDVHVRAVSRCIHPRRDRRGFLQESR